MTNAALNPSSAYDEDEVVWGAEDIGKVVNVPPRKAFYMLENGLLPADSWSPVGKHQAPA